MSLFKLYVFRISLLISFIVVTVSAAIYVGVEKLSFGQFFYATFLGYFGGKILELEL